MVVVVSDFKIILLGGILSQLPHRKTAKKRGSDIVGMPRAHLNQSAVDRYVLTVERLTKPPGSCDAKDHCLQSEKVIKIPRLYASASVSALPSPPRMSSRIRRCLSEICSSRFRAREFLED
jgi:hypothetical protein